MTLDKKVEGLEVVFGEEGNFKPVFKCQICHETIDQHGKGVVVWHDKENTAFIIHKDCLNPSSQVKSTELDLFLGRANLEIGLPPSPEIIKKLKMLGKLE